MSPPLSDFEVSISTVRQYPSELDISAQASTAFGEWYKFKSRARTSDENNQIVGVNQKINHLPDYIGETLRQKILELDTEIEGIIGPDDCLFDEKMKIVDFTANTIYAKLDVLKHQLLDHKLSFTEK